MLRDPFTAEDEVSLYVPRDATEAALGGLRQAIRDQAGTIALVGPVGIGKSMLLKVLESSMASERCCVRVEYQGLSAGELCQWILRELDARETLETERVLNRPTLAKLRDWVQRDRSYANTDDPEQGLAQLAADFQSRGFGLLVLIDGADALKAETARRLLDVSQRANGALSFVLALTQGLPDTDATLEALGSSRATISITTAMTLDETIVYIKERLSRAGASQELRACLDESRIRRIYKYSEGNPRRLHGEVGLIHLELSRVRAGIAVRPESPTYVPSPDRPWLSPKPPAEPEPAASPSAPSLEVAPVHVSSTPRVPAPPTVEVLPEAEVLEERLDPEGALSDSDLVEVEEAIEALGADSPEDSKTDEPREPSASAAAAKVSIHEAAHPEEPTSETVSPEEPPSREAPEPGEVVSLASEVEAEPRAEIASEAEASAAEVEATGGAQTEAAPTAEAQAGARTETAREEPAAAADPAQARDGVFFWRRRNRRRQEQRRKRAETVTRLFDTAATDARSETARAPEVESSEDTASGETAPDARNATARTSAEAAAQAPSESSLAASDGDEPEAPCAPSPATEGPLEIEAEASEADAATLQAEPVTQADEAEAEPQPADASPAVDENESPTAEADAARTQAEREPRDEGESHDAREAAAAEELTSPESDAPAAEPSDAEPPLRTEDAQASPALLAEVQRDWEELASSATRLSDVRLPPDLVPLHESAAAEAARASSNRLLVGVALAAVLALGGLGLALMAGDQAAAPSEPDASPDVAAAAPVAPADSEPPVVQEPAVDEASQPASLPATEEPEPAVVLININAKPWATIEIDGESVGETPLGEVPLTEGEHVFRATLPTGRVVERTELIGPDNTRIIFE